MPRLRSLLTFLLVPAATALNVGDIEHFLVLFFENQSFDRIFGCAGDELPGIDGVDNETMGNFVDPNDESKGFVKATCGAATYVCTHDEDHSFPAVTTQVFGPGATDGAAAPYPPATMTGFANVSSDSLALFAPEQLPVKIALAKEFAVFNRLYAAIPGPSMPNHMFAQSATSCGSTETGTLYNDCGGKLPLFPQRTIYESLLDAGKDFAIFYNGTLREGGVPGDLYMSGLLKHALGRAHVFDAPTDGFFDRAAAGTLPAFSWMLPRNGGATPNDDHPCHDLARGEELLKSVYEALRAGPKWNQTALLVVYDDTGGWYDHAPTPLSAPKPGAACEAPNAGCPDAFAFDRLGGRLANLLISPWVARGTVVQDPREGPVAGDSKFELSSIPATVKNLFGLPSFLNARDAWAGSFTEVLNLTAPRADAPAHAPEPPPFSQNVQTVHGCGDPDDVTRRQKRHLDLFDAILGDEDEWEDVAEHAERVTSSFAAARAKIARRVAAVFARLADGSLKVSADEL